MRSPNVRYPYLPMEAWWIILHMIEYSPEWQRVWITRNLVLWCPSLAELKAKTGAHTKHNEITLVLPWITIYIHFLHTYPNSLACLPDTMKAKTCSAMVPLQKNSRVKAPSHYVVHVAPPHSALTTSDGSIKGGIAETRDFIKRRDSNQSMPGSLK